MRLGESVVFVLLAAGLGSPVAAQELPRFVQELIARREGGSSRSFREIWSYRYKGETVYFIPQSPLLSDSMSELYGSTGALICKPDGGYFGHGDGKCPDFFTARTMGALVWSPRGATRPPIAEPGQPPAQSEVAR